MQTADTAVAPGVPQLNEVAAAHAAHEANRAYCRSQGDDSQPPWDEAPDWQKDSALAGVMAIAKNPDITSKQSHQGWMAMKAEAGWVYGETKDADKKVHPCMVPYSELPPRQQRKDYIFGAVVRAVLGIN